MKTLHKILFIAVAAMFLATQAKAVLYWGRPYDPNLQRWIQRDPIGEQGGINLYRFVGNNPTIFVDPWGFWSIVQQNPDQSITIYTSYTPMEGITLPAGSLEAIDEYSSQPQPDSGGIDPDDPILFLGAGKFATEALETRAAAGLGEDGYCSASKVTVNPSRLKPISAEQAQRLRDAFNKGLDMKFKTGGGVDEMRLILKENGATDEQITELLKDIIKNVRR